MPSTRERFERLITPEPNTGCWFWVGSVGRNGYGQFWIRPRMTAAHRTSYAIYVGPIGEGLSVCHRCDQPTCVNPAHLFLGTHADNMADCRAKGRDARGALVHFERGTKHPRATLTDQAVAEIRRLWGTAPAVELAVRFGVRDSTIHKVATRKAWTHV